MFYFPVRRYQYLTLLLRYKVLIVHEIENAISRTWNCFISLSKLCVLILVINSENLDTGIGCLSVSSTTLLYNELDSISGSDATGWSSENTNST